MICSTHFGVMAMKFTKNMHVGKYFCSEESHSYTYMLCMICWRCITFFFSLMPKIKDFCTCIPANEKKNDSLSLRYHCNVHRIFGPKTIIKTFTWFFFARSFAKKNRPCLWYCFLFCQTNLFTIAHGMCVLSDSLICWMLQMLWLLFWFITPTVLPAFLLCFFVSVATCQIMRSFCCLVEPALDILFTCLFVLSAQNYNGNGTFPKHKYP